MKGKKRRIAILTPTFHHYSGIDRVAEQQADSLTKKGHSVLIMCLEASITKKPYKIIQLGMPASSFLQRLYRLFFFLNPSKMNAYKLLKKYDEVISHFYPMNLIAAKAKKEFGTTYIYHNHGINTKANDSLFQTAYMKLFGFFSNRSLRTVDKAYSVSDYLRKELKKETGIGSKVRYNLIDKRFNRKVNGSNIKKRYGIEKKQVILYLGRLAPHKGVHLLLRSFKRVQKKRPDTVLLVVGKPTFSRYYQKLQDAATSNVIFTGFVDDKELPQFYAACDVYATASLWEGFDLPAAEAQACGKPVVAFDIGSHPEIVKKGKLVPKGNVKRFTNAIMGILKK